MGIYRGNKFQLDEHDADTILRLKAATMFAEIGYKGNVACAVRNLYERDSDGIAGYVNNTLLQIQYEGKYGL